MVSENIQYYLADIGELTPYARNARTHSDEQIAQIAASIKEFGFLAPIVISGDNTILCGHGRFYAAQRLGLKKIPCIKEEHLTETQRRAYIIADNKLSLNAGWDDNLLAVEIADLQGENFDLSLTGFDEKEIADLFSDGKKSNAQEDNCDLTAALEKAAFVVRGDIWTVGRHRLMCGDATSPDDVSALVDGKKANLIVTDPPYGVSFTSSSGLKIQNDSIKGEEFLKTAERHTSFTRTPRAYASAGRSSMRDFTLRAFVYGSRIRLCWDAPITSGSTNRCYTAF